MSVKIGSARIDERGKTTGGQAGDQKSEVSTQNWYKHSKGWYVFRAKDAEVREYIAQAMQWACDNNAIGYDQNQRTTLYNNVKEFGFDPRKTTKNVETDCSALVRVCICYATNRKGNLVDPGNFRTATQKKMLMDTGIFDIFTDDNHCYKSDYLARGDILCTKTSGHTVVVQSNGPKCDADSKIVSTDLSKGSKGDKVKSLQLSLISIGYDLGKYGADGDFGSATETAVKKFQTDNNLEVDGIVGEKTLEKINELLAKSTTGKLKVTAAAVNVRTNPDTNSKVGTIIGVVHKNDELTYQGQESNGFYLVIYKGENAWISSKYTKIM